MSNPLKALRDRIDRLDDELLRLVNERAQLAREIGKLKGEATVYRPEREAQVLRRLAERNAGPLPAKAVTHLFTEIISACRALEDAFAVACLGPRGTFSEEAVMKHFGGQAPAVLCPSIDDVFRTVEAGTVGYAVVPVENSTEGAVGRTLDLLVSTPLKICGEVLLPIHQNLLSRLRDPGAIRRIYSHAQSLAQCNGWLNAHCPHAERIPVGSNAEAARRAAEDAESAAVAGRMASEQYQLPVLVPNIEDDPNNTTRFAVLAPDDALASGKDKTSFIMSAKNRPGAIHELLTPLAQNAVSMTRLESRPSRTGLWEYVFFVDVEGHRTEPHVAHALEEVRNRAAFLKILGSYPVAIS
ncbi:MAG TPA: prephenate dehydratase [Burkholderiales bacterium]|jgi:chorismate mutase/prephenate dehydratase|nr:prephenate dehydratase [Burkholderiales bacterium]